MEGHDLTFAGGKNTSQAGMPRLIAVNVKGNTLPIESMSISMDLLQRREAKAWNQYCHGEGEGKVRLV